MIDMPASLLGVLVWLAANPGVVNQSIAQPVPSHAVLSIAGSNLGGFSEVSGLTTDTNVGEYREGESGQNHPIKVTGINKTTDVTLKRGVVSDTSLYDWLHGVTGKDVVIKLQPAVGPPSSFHLRNCKPVKYTGPPLGHGKTSGQIAIEELVLSCESITLVK